MNQILRRFLRLTEKIIAFVNSSCIADYIKSCYEINPLLFFSAHWNLKINFRDFEKVFVIIKYWKTHYVYMLNLVKTRLKLKRLDQNQN